jgi:hypothetical protein
MVVLPPPATSTSPFGSSVAVWPVRAVVMLPVEVQVLELPRAGTAVLANRPMISNPADTNEQIAAERCILAEIMPTSY